MHFKPPTQKRSALRSGFTPNMLQTLHPADVAVYCLIHRRHARGRKAGLNKLWLGVIYRSLRPHTIFFKTCGEYKQLPSLKKTDVF